jgi:hypothetical protein
VARQLACSLGDTLKIKDLVWLPKCNASTNTRLENLGGAGVIEVLTNRGSFGIAFRDYAWMQYGTLARREGGFRTDSPAGYRVRVQLFENRDSITRISK